MLEDRTVQTIEAVEPGDGTDPQGSAAILGQGGHEIGAEAARILRVVAIGDESAATLR